MTLSTKRKVQMNYTRHCCLKAKNSAGSLPAPTAVLDLWYRRVTYQSVNSQRKEQSGFFL